MAKKKATKKVAPAGGRIPTGNIEDVRSAILARIREELALLDELAHVSGYDKGAGGFGRYGKV